MYNKLLRPLLFKIDSERAHHLAMTAGKVLSARPFSSFIRAACAITDPRLATSVFGKKFSHPLGLAAGFDKHAEAVPFLSALGFSHVELGSVTALPQRGNDRPRMFRLPKDEALINRMGFPSVGVDQIVARLQKLPPQQAVIGINIGKTKSVELDRAAEDYIATFKKLAPYAGYVAINVSSPNTPELRKLQERPRLKALLSALQLENQNKIPLLVKVAPDLSLAELSDILSLAFECNLSGIIATNTTISRDGLQEQSHEAGGLSGAPLRSKSLEILRFLFTESGGRIPLIGVGGINSAADVIERLAAGASLVQLYSALIYRGPGLIRKIVGDLSRELDRRGLSSLGELSIEERATTDRSVNSRL